MGIRNLIASLKARTAQSFYEATIRNGIGNGPKARPFNADAAVRAFHSWAYAAAMLNAYAFASTPKRLYVRASEAGGRQTRALKPSVRRYFAGEGDTQPGRAVLTKFARIGGDLVEVVGFAPELEVLRTVNPWENGFEHEVLRMLDLQMTGNAYMHVVDDATGQPAEVWRMQPRYVEIVTSQANWIEGYKYGVPGQVRDYTPDEVIHFRVPGPTDPVYGSGWFAAAWSALGLHASKREVELSMFDNYARPDWLLSVPGGKPEAMDKMEEKLSEKFRDKSKRSAGRSAFLVTSAEVKAQALNWQIPDTGTPTRVIEEIAAVSGVPVAMLLSNDPNKAGGETARLHWYRNTIQPYCRLEEEKLNEKWLPRFGNSDALLIAHDPANFEDQTAAATRVSMLVKAGIYTANEARAEMNKPPHEDGDELYAPTGATGGGVMNGSNDDETNQPTE